MDVYKLNKKYEQNNFNGVECNNCNYNIIEGNIPIILSAAHAVKHVRCDLTKKADGLTGGIVEYLAINKKCFGIIRNYNLQDDPNYYNSGQSMLYKNRIVDLIKKYQIKYLLDIHGFRDDYPFDIEIGTNNGINIDNNLIALQILIDNFKKIGVVSVDEKFKASKRANISKYIYEKTGIPCFQIEICKTLRYDKTKDLIKIIGNIIDDLSKIIENKQI